MFCEILNPVAGWSFELPITIMGAIWRLTGGWVHDHDHDHETDELAGTTVSPERSCVRKGDDLILGALYAGKGGWARE